MTSASGRGTFAPAQAPGAVVIGGDYQGLGIVRSLGRRGIPVLVVDDERSISPHSRYSRGSVRVPLGGESQTAETLLEIGRQRHLDGWVLFPTRDNIVSAISRHRAELADLYRVPTPDWDVISWAADKRKTHALALELGVPTPSTAWPESEDELRSLDVPFPVAVKPAFKEPFVSATGAKAWRADSPSELTELFRRAARIVPNGQVMVQQLIPGGGDSQLAHCSLFKNGESLASMQVRRRRQHPWEFGRASTFVETVVNQEVEEYAERILRRLDYYGLVEIEFKFDQRDQRCKLLDINPRTWGYHTLGAAAGADFPHLLYLDQIGEPVPTSQAVPGVKWLRLLTDIPTGVVDIIGHRISAGSYLQSIRTADTEAVWDRHDLRPWFAELALLPYLIVKRGF